MNSYRPAQVATADLEPAVAVQPAVAGEPAVEAARTPASVQTKARESDECMACGHTPDRHDRIAQRYCDATISGVLTRGCICPSP